MFLELLGADHVHLEQCRGTHEECVRYTSKLESRIYGPWRIGNDEDVGQGRRTDLDDIQAMLDSGKSVNEVAKTHFGHWCRYRQAFTDYARNVKAERDIKRFDASRFNVPLCSFEKTKAWLIWGRTGTGKTNFALAHFKKPLLVRQLDDLKGLEDHDGIVCADHD